MSYKLQSIAENLEASGRDILTARTNIRNMIDALRQVQDMPELGKLDEITNMMEVTYNELSNVCVRLRQLSGGS